MNFLRNYLTMDALREKWNRHWLERADRPLEADEWLVRAAPLLPPPGRALDIACGRGRNTLFLAERGWEVVAMDQADEGLALLAAEGKDFKRKITVKHVDLEQTTELPVGFDLVMLFFYLQRSLLPHLRAAVAPGGLAVVRTFSSAGDFPGGPENPDFVLRPGELKEVFAGWEILRHEEGLEAARRGGGLAGVVARKPA